ncbi:MAG: hypothetical protein ACJ74Q_14990 [Pyrinomonadaceae bacterium]
MTGTTTPPAHTPYGQQRLPPGDDDAYIRQDFFEDDAPEPPDDDERLFRLADELELLAEVDGPKDLF